MPPSPSPIRHWARAFAVASLVHVTLPDFQQPGWWAPALIEVAGALLLLIRPSALGFGLCLVGTLWPLLFLRDVLTQSMYLTWVAAVGLGGTALKVRANGVFSMVRVLTSLTYLIAAFHKLNTTFFGPESCAPHAWLQVAEHWGLPVIPTGPLPYVAIALEVALGVAIWRRSAWMWPLGLVFHLPLTLTLAPAFGAVMLSGYVAATSPRAAARWRRAAWRWRSILAVALVGLVAEWLIARDPVTALKVGAAGALAAGSVLAFGKTRPVRTSVAAWIVGGLWCLHGATPYLGIQYQHTAAMLSNLRVDEGCWNHLLVPEVVRIGDPYIRIDEASFGQPRTERVAVLKALLWSGPALAAMHDNWCIPENRPVRLEGTHHDVRFTMPDLCSEDWSRYLPHPPWLNGFQRFQKNLPRECPAACVH